MLHYSREHSSEYPGVEVWYTTGKTLPPPTGPRHEGVDPTRFDYGKPDLWFRNIQQFIQEGE